MSQPPPPFHPWRTQLMPSQMPSAAQSSSSSSSNSSLTVAHFAASALVKKELMTSTETLPDSSVLPRYDIYSQAGLQRFSALYKMSGGNPEDPVGPANNRESLNMKMQQTVEANIGDFAKKQILQILESISVLKPPERILLYMRMPGANCETDPLRQPQNPLGARSEINHTINWVRSHLEPDPNVSIPKKDVYDDYIAFCARVNIKPLSTADFGKVMKQVFPSVRPRRLGTRGHSRYCYAAMRKATKLDPPLLPDLTESKGSEKTNFLNIAQNGGGGSVADHQDSWLIIQKWAEDLLNKKFHSASDLASHILKFNLSGSAKEAAKEQHLAVMGKKTRDKKKDVTEKVKAAPAKKRRPKKKRKTSSSTDEDNSEPVRLMIKRERPGDTSDDNAIVDLKVHGTNSCDKTVVANTNRAAVAPPPSAVTVKNYLDVRKETVVDSMPRHGVKLLINDVPLEEQQNTVQLQQEQQQIENILCKKVRQAQQAKGLWMQQQQQQQQTQQNSVIVSPYELKPHNFSLPEIASPSMLSSSMRAERSPREKKLLKQPEINKDSTVDGGLPVDFIIPRERVISICNMDKDALDDYLQVAADNSQEAEIMQYFDEASSNTPSTVDTGNNTPKMAYATDLTVIQNNSSLLDSYNMFPETKPADPKAGTPIQNHSCNSSQEPPENPLTIIKHEQTGGGGTEDQIIQLRQYLHQNLQQQSAMPGMNMKGNVSHLTVDQSSSMNFNYPGSASASLAMLSQRHIVANFNPVGMDLTQESAAGQMAGQLGLVQKRKALDAAAAEEIPQRRRNFSFVPIASPISPHGGTGNGSKVIRNDDGNQYNDFVSPKMTGFKKTGGNIIKPTFSQGASQVNATGQLQFSNVMPQSAIFPSNERKTAFSKPVASSTSASRKEDGQQSPLIESGARTIQLANYNGNEVTDPKPTSSSALPYENRSQSVPLSYRNSPIMINPSHVLPAGNYNNSYNNNNNNSTCSSMAQTPIPPEYNDFTEMMDILNMPPSDQSDAMLSPGNSSGKFKDSNNNNNDEFLGESTTTNKSSFGSIVSRSVPTTPVPTGSSSYYPRASMYNNGNQGFGMYGNINGNRRSGGYDASKSVPTTPISSSANPFRYSPITDGALNARDFLINGNLNVEPNKMNFYQSSDVGGETLNRKPELAQFEAENKRSEQPGTSGEIMDKVLPGLSPLNDSMTFYDPFGFD